jgi:hypothetical protein
MTPSGQKGGPVDKKKETAPMISTKAKRRIKVACEKAVCADRKKVETLIREYGDRFYAKGECESVIMHLNDYWNR